MTADQRLRFLDHLRRHRAAELRLRAELRDSKRPLTREERSERRYRMKNRGKPQVLLLDWPSVGMLPLPHLGPPLSVQDPRSDMHRCVRSIGNAIDRLTRQITKDISVLDAAMQSTTGASRRRNQRSSNLLTLIGEN